MASLHYRYTDAGPHQGNGSRPPLQIEHSREDQFVGGWEYLRGVARRIRQNFQVSFDYTGVGMNKSRWSYNVKSFYAGQKIGSHLEAQAGGIEYDRGAGTEATYADNDGWLDGYRLR